MPNRQTGVRASPSRIIGGLTVVGVLVGATAAGAVLLRSKGPDAAIATEPPATGSPGATSSTAPPPTAPTTVPTTAPPTSLPPTTVPPAPPAIEGLRPGAEGPEVLALQTRLEELGFWLGGADGHYAHLTEQAVMAFQKANGLDRDGIAGPATMAALATAARPTPNVVTDGIEIDLERQLLLVVSGGQVVHALNTSTGTAGWRTPAGDFTIDRQVDGMRHAPLGDLFRPKYFNGGIAIHGAASVPGYPASHGCARVSTGAINMLWSSGLAEVGTRVVVY